MTGYGKAECQLSNGKITIEIRSLNGKNADISLKTSIIPRDKEMQVRQTVAKELVRGNIDIYATYESNASENTKVINKEVFDSYYNQIIALEKPFSAEEVTCAILKLPEVIENKKQEITDESWKELSKAIEHALIAINEFRAHEGEILYKDVTSRVDNILEYLLEVEKHEPVRVSAVKERLTSKIEELNINPDKNRLEQEIIFYIEKLDVNEEKVRLRQHCKYFMETINNEPNPGKKLGFIVQEMGREINTLGSKSNQADMQQLVVKMKDELEKIKEQSLNIL